MVKLIEHGNYKFQDSNSDGWITLGDALSGDKVFGAEAGVELSISQIQQRDPSLLEPKIIAKNEGEARALLAKVSPEISMAFSPIPLRSAPVITQSNSGVRLSPKAGAGLLGALVVVGALAYSWFSKPDEVDPELGLYSPRDFWIGDFPPSEGDEFIINPNEVVSPDEQVSTPAEPKQFVVRNEFDSAAESGDEDGDPEFSEHIEELAEKGEKGDRDAVVSHLTEHPEDIEEFVRYAKEGHRYLDVDLVTDVLVQLGRIELAADYQVHAAELALEHVEHDAQGLYYGAQNRRKAAMLYLQANDFQRYREQMSLAIEMLIGFGAYNEARVILKVGLDTFKQMAQLDSETWEPLAKFIREELAKLAIIPVLRVDPVIINSLTETQESLDGFFNVHFNGANPTMKNLIVNTIQPLQTLADRYAELGDDRLYHAGDIEKAKHAFERAKHCYEQLDDPGSAATMQKKIDDLGVSTPVLDN